MTGNVRPFNLVPYSQGLNARESCICFWTSHILTAVDRDCGVELALHDGMNPNAYYFVEVVAESGPSSKKPRNARLLSMTLEIRISWRGDSACAARPPYQRGCGSVVDFRGDGLYRNRRVPVPGELRHLLHERQQRGDSRVVRPDRHRYDGAYMHGQPSARGNHAQARSEEGREKQFVV